MTAEATSQHTGSNGDLPVDEVDAAVTALIKAADAARAERDSLREHMDALNDKVARYERAVKALTAPRPERKPKPGRKPRSQLKNQGGDNYAPGQPVVGEERLQNILAAIEAARTPVSTKEVSEVTGLTRQTVSAGFAHLRHRGVARLAGRTKGGGHLIAMWHEGDPVEDDA